MQLSITDVAINVIILLHNDAGRFPKDLSMGYSDDGIITIKTDRYWMQIGGGKFEDFDAELQEEIEREIDSSLPIVQEIKRFLLNSNWTLVGLNLQEQE